MKGRAIRALGKLQDPKIESWLRPLAEAVAQSDAAKIDAAKMRVTADQLSSVGLQRAALEALRDIGDSSSLDVLRRARTRYLNQPELTQPSFQVAEEIYWRLTGGMERESYSAEGQHKANKKVRSQHKMPFQKIPNLDVEYALIAFDHKGVERTDDPVGGVFSRALIDKVRQEQPSHIFLFSHGWKGDLPSAIDQYNRWIGAMWNRQADRQAMGPDFRPLFIGLHWPSQPWGEETIGGAPTSFGTADAPAIDAVMEAAVQHFGGSPEVRRPLEVIFRAFEENPAARILPDEVVTAYQDLANAIGFSAGSGNAPDQEGAPLDPQAAVRAERLAGGAASFGVFDTIKSGILSGLRQTSFWLMKHRARTVGEQGMHSFVAALQQVSKAKIHLMGHSFGCIVVSSILGGPGGTQALPRPVDSAVLVQGALSLWSFADKLPKSTDPGYFRPVVTRGAVSGPIVTTQSAKDTAVGLAYPAAVGLVGEVDFGPTAPLPEFGGVGTFGIQGTSIAETHDMQDENAAYGFKPGHIYNLNGTPFIAGHSAIDGPQVAHVLWQATLPAVMGQRV